MASQPELQSLSNLRGVDVVAVRLFFRERLDMPRAASVAGGGMAPGEAPTAHGPRSFSGCSTIVRPAFVLVLYYQYAFKLVV